MSTTMLRPQPQVSVIIAAYNCAPYLGLAIESALAQTFDDLEVVVVDDASTDDTLAVAGEYARTGRVRVLVNASNAGPSQSRNRAIEAANGKWVVQLDGDDWMAPSRVARLVALAEQEAADVVADDLLVVDDATMVPVSSRFLDKNVTWQSARQINAADLIRHDLGSIKPLLRRQFLIEQGLAYQADIRYGEDFLFLLRALLRGARFWVLPEPLYRLRRGNTGSLTTQKAAMYRQTEAVTRQLMADYEVRAHATIVQALQRRLTYLGQLSMLSGVTTALSRGRLLEATSRLLRKPTLAFVLAKRLPLTLSTRWRRVKTRRFRNEFLPQILQGAPAFCEPRHDGEPRTTRHHQVNTAPLDRGSALP